MSDQEKTTQGILNYLPVMVAFFALNVPAGLGIYWIANNILTTLITLAVKAGIKVTTRLSLLEILIYISSAICFSFL
jgi:membrane protein insertase Oxa1/YidC/SpoIIIJ